jgi:hypothetical protein
MDPTDAVALDAPNLHLAYEEIPLFVSAGELEEEEGKTRRIESGLFPSFQLDHSSA